MMENLGDGQLFFFIIFQDTLPLGTEHTPNFFDLGNSVYPRNIEKNTFSLRYIQEGFAIQYSFYMV